MRAAGTGIPARWPHALPAGQRAAALLAFSALVLATVALAGQDWRRAALVPVGALLGMSLYHGAFGFTSAYREAIRHRQVGGVLAQLVMLGLAMLLFAPVLARGEAFGHGVTGAVAPAGLQVAIGSFLFGLGMQLGGGCGSGTLYTVGGGSTRMVVTLAAFCAGAFLGSLDMGRWAALPGPGAVSLATELGYGRALALQLAVLAALWLALRRWGRGVRQRPLWGQKLSWRGVLAGPWPLLLSAAMLALLNLATLLIAGHPWTVTWAFTLWGAKAAMALGWDPASSAFWAGGWTGGQLRRSILEDNISIIDLAIIGGALLAAAMAGRFAPLLRVPPKALVAALLGGLLMGYGARLSYGCNIGAFFSGVASFSLHGWLWIACALPGTWLGIRLRPLFGLDR